MRRNLDYAITLEDLRGSEDIWSAEFLIRLCLVLSAAFLGWFVLDLNVLLIWVPLYYALVSTEKLLLRRNLGLSPKTVFFLVLFLSFLISSVFVFLPVYLWYLGGDIWRLAALVILTGGVLNIFLLRSRHWRIGLAYVLPVAMAFFAIAADFFTPPSANSIFWCAVFLASAMTIYLLVAVWEAHKANKRLRMTRDQFHQAQKVEALGTLTGGIAHDFNNLLAVIRGNLELLQQYPSEPDAPKFIEEAIASVDRGADLTRALLAYIRKSDLRPERVDPAQVLRSVQIMTKRAFKPNINVSLSIETKGAEIIVDKSMLEAALLNLCINSRDAMPDGGNLELSAYHVPSSPESLPDAIQGSYLVIEVRDSGEGIASADQELVFDPFYTTKPPGEGTGLGLAMVKGFAQQSGGDASIASSVGQGTTVSILLPDEVTDKSD